MRAHTTLSLTSDANPSGFGDAVSITAEVNVAGLGSGSPSGMVIFSEGNTVLGAATMDDAGQATLTTAALVPGDHAISAHYGGDDHFEPAATVFITQSIDKATPAITLATSIPTAAFGQSVTLTATVDSHLALPTSLITFFDGDTALGTGTLDTSGVASFDAIGLDVGSHLIQASYSGDDDFSSAHSSGSTLQVHAAATSLSLTSSSDQSNVGQTVALTALLTVNSPGQGTPTGSITFFDGTTIIGSAALGTDGIATLSSSALTAGTHEVSAVYVGTDDFASSTSDELEHTVKRNNAAPTVAKAAAASKLTAGSTKSALTALGADDAHESNLTYRWSTLSGPKGALPRFSSNGKNSSKKITVTFDHAGSYRFAVRMTDQSGLSVVSTVAIKVQQSLQSIRISPSKARIADGTTEQFRAVQTDQFGDALSAPLRVKWSVASGAGSINSHGLFTAGGVSAAVVVKATVSSIHSTATLTITPRRKSPATSSRPPEPQAKQRTTDSIASAVLSDEGLPPFSEVPFDVSIASINDDGRPARSSPKRTRLIG